MAAAVREGICFHGFDNNFDCFVVAILRLRRRNAKKCKFEGDAAPADAKIRILPPLS